jgi:hypothetical protein
VKFIWALTKSSKRSRQLGDRRIGSLHRLCFKGILRISAKRNTCGQHPKVAHQIQKFNITPLGWLQDYGRVFNRSFLAGGHVLYDESSYFLIRNKSSSAYSLNNIYYGLRDLIRANRTNTNIRGVAVYEYSLRSTMVDAKVKCISEDCEVYQMRRSPQPRGISEEYSERTPEIRQHSHACIPCNSRTCIRMEPRSALCWQP